jgi:uncharacterized membrane protein
MAKDADQTCSVIIEASPEQCFDVITDFASYPKWNKALTKAVVEKERRGVAKQVAFELDARVKKIRYVLAYSQHRPRELTWSSVDGDVREISGSYRFKKLDADRTEATCRQTIDLGFWLPGPLRRLAEATALEQSVAEFKAEAERRARAAAKKSQKKR